MPCLRSLPGEGYDLSQVTSELTGIPGRLGTPLGMGIAENVGVIPESRAGRPDGDVSIPEGQGVYQRGGDGYTRRGIPGWWVCILITSSDMEPGIPSCVWLRVCLFFIKKGV